MRFSRTWRRAANARHFDDEGFTLIEMTISIVILAIVIGAIALALMTVLMLSGNATKSILSSADAQVVSANLTNDVQSAAEITTRATTPTATITSTTGIGRHWCGSGTRLLGLEWDQVPGKATTYDTVVSYLAVHRGSTWVLVRAQCTAGSSGYSSTPSNSATVASHICAPSATPAQKGCTNVTQVPPTITSRTPNATGIETSSAAAGWTSAATVAGVKLKITEPKGYYSHTLVADPAASGTSNGTTKSPAPQATGCGYATPTTGTAEVPSQTLCFVNFNKYTFAKAAYTKTHPTKCQTITEPITDTPFSLSLCLSVEAGTESNDEAPPSGWGTKTHPGSCGDGPAPPEATSGVPPPPHPPARPCTDPSSADIVAVPFPTYTHPPGSEAFLGNNGFFTGVPGDPALYTYLEGTAVTLYFSTIEVVAPDSTLATNWYLVTGDAESTDGTRTGTGPTAHESITWSTCPAKTTGVHTGAQQTSCSGTPPLLSLIPNSPTSLYGNACMDKTYTNAPTNGWLRYGNLATGQGTYFKASTAQPEVECAAGVSADKTGTVMLKAPKPGTLTVNIVGQGLQAVFLGILL